MAKHQPTIEFASSKPEAERIARDIFKSYTPYMKRQYGLPTVSTSGSKVKETTFIVWYWL